jgi:hypothetical protein
LRGESVPHGIETDHIIGIDKPILVIYHFGLLSKCDEFGVKGIEGGV